MEVSSFFFGADGMCCGKEAFANDVQIGMLRAIRTLALLGRTFRMWGLMQRC